MLALSTYLTSSLIERQNGVLGQLGHLLLYEYQVRLREPLADFTAFLLGIEQLFLIAKFGWHLILGRAFRGHTFLRRLALLQRNSSRRMTFLG